MGLFSSDICDYCSSRVKTGIKSKHCGHWICGNCIAQRSVRTSHIFGKDTMLCPLCGEDTGLHHEAIVARVQGRG